MAVALQNDPLRATILSELRRMNAAEEPLEAMVRFVQRELGFSEDFIVPVLGYMCAAFELPLKELLPLRDCWELNGTREYAALTTRIRSRATK